MMGDDDDRTPEHERVRDALRALPPVVANAEFRARARREFTGSGEVAKGRRPLAVALALAASIALALGGLVWVANRGGPWTIAATSGVGVVEVDGRAIDLADAAALASALRPGVRISTDARAELELGIEGSLALVVTPETTLRLPAAPGRWFDRNVTAALERGEIRGHTGRRFGGARLRIDLAGGSVEVAGTTFAVLENAEGSCVCVLDGTVRMEERGGTFVVAPGRRRVIPPGASAGRDEPIRSVEAMKLEMLRQQLDAAATAGFGPPHRGR